MTPSCLHCHQPFEITPDDLAFLAKISPVIGGKQQLIPPPTLCPACRQQRRIAWRNERSFHRRRCDGVGKQIIAMYPADTPFPVFSQDYWWSDKWDPSAYALTWDPEKSFFDQFAVLLSKVPRLGCIVSMSENCEYNNFCVRSKNCYMSQRLGDSEDALYSYLPIESRSVTDCYNISNCDLCFDVIDATTCYNVRHAQNVVGCSDSAYLFNCRDCRSCFLCTNLRGGEFFFRNQKLSKEAYERAIAAFPSGLRSSHDSAQEIFSQLRAESIVPALWASNAENVSGNYLTECKNARTCFDCRHCEDIAYSYGHVYGTDCMDSTFGFHCDLCYDFAAGSNAQQLQFCFNILYDCHHLQYCIDCVNGSHDLFGCISMKHAQYCIFNKQYTKDEYETLVPQIINTMRRDGEWGEYFPISISPFGYNETVGQEYFPLTKSEVTKRGWKWLDLDSEQPTVSRSIRGADLPGSIDEIPDDILNWAIECEITKKPFRIIRQELEFHRKMRLPVPRLHPDERHRLRMALRNPRRLWNRQCAKCKASIMTSYAPERLETVYCEKCYLASVY